MIKHNKGLTLIEVLVTVAIITVVAGVAFPLYQEQARKGRRTSAMDAMTQIASNLDRCYSNMGGYDCCEGAENAVSKVLPGGPPYITSDGYYQITPNTTNSDANLPACKMDQGYMITAVPVAGTSQASDTCRSFSLDHLGNRTALDENSNSKPSCWSDL